MRCKKYLIGIFVLTFAGVTGAQTVQVNQQNRTIELSTEGTIEVQADLVTIKVGYHNYGASHDAAYDENVRASTQILKAWTDAGVSEKDVSTRSLSLSPVSDADLKEMAVGDRKTKQFEASQSWTITANAAVAQRLLDIGVAAGANEVDDPQWKLSDPDSAEAKAYASALEKARVIATKMADAFGARVGVLLYASNEGRPLPFLTTLNTASATITTRSSTATRVHPVKLLPQKVEKSALVRAIFALE
jgi:uncharacterized protein